MTLLHSFLINLLISCLLSPQFSLQHNTTTSSNSDQIIVSKPNCPSKCGNVTVPYPFGIGIGSNCSLNSWFDVYCDATVEPPYMLVSTRDDYRLVDISDSQIRITTPFFASRCYGNSTMKGTNLTLDFSGTPYTLSDSNRLTQVGCSDLAVFQGFSDQFPVSSITTQNNFASGCVAFCSNGDISLNGSCPGNGCCQIPVPRGTLFLNSSITGLQDRWRNEEVKPCSYSFIGEQDSFSFQAVSDLYRPPMTISNWLVGVTVALDWRIGTEDCQQARNSGGFACQRNSDCVDADAGVGGYRCSCSRGYQGNPYLPPGCHDIDECKNNPCHLTGICINTPGEYSCGCPEGYYGHGWRNSSGCFPVTLPTSKLSKLSIGLISGMGFITLLSLSLLLTKFVRKRKNNNQKQKFFKQNGGLLLKQGHALGKTRLFTAKELEKATDRFNETRILGRGGQGTVYKGMLSDGQIVAIKKSPLIAAHDHNNKSNHIVQQFINEVVILSQINHRNVVQLHGCCLETKVPLLVYEFAPNGTLFDHIHDGDINAEFPFSWNVRVKILADVAGALAYLHSATSLPIYHRDVKSSNILLDEKYVAKVSDFGTSKSVEVDQTHLTTNVNGTFGYIDPEYFQSSQFTEKSDVYSFGVVIVELLTGLKPIIASSKAEEVDRSLVSRFLSSMDENNLDSILDSQVSVQGDKEGVVAVGRLAERCLNLNGKKRPYMKEVAMELENVRRAQMGLSVETKLAEDCSSFHRERSMAFSTQNSNYSWTTTSDFPTNSSDLYPMMLDTV